MNRWLNLHEIGGKFLFAIAILTIGIPVALSLFAQASRQSSSTGSMVGNLIQISVFLGMSLLVVFIALLIFEQVLDHRLYKFFLKNRGKKLEIAEGIFECQYCGFRSVNEFDSVCPACGKPFKEK